MDYAELVIHTTTVACEAVEEMLRRLGAQGMATEDPTDALRLINEPGSLVMSDNDFTDALPDHVIIRAYFPENVLQEPDFLSRVEEELQQIAEFLPVGSGCQGLNLVKEEDWANSWKSYYHPLSISQRLVVCPGWEEYEPQEGELVMNLDPGSAFGTGTHASTSLAAQLLDEYMEPDSVVLDVGSGSGILSIGAAILGAKSVDALDIDPTAVKTCIENVAKNDLAESIECIVGVCADAPKKQYDLIVMNIVAEIVAEESERVFSLLPPGGQFISSGIIEYKQEIAESAFKKAGFEIIEMRKKESWLAYICRKPQQS